MRNGGRRNCVGGNAQGIAEESESTPQTDAHNSKRFLMYLPARCERIRGKVIECEKI